MPKLTKRIVDALRPAEGRDVFAWDSELRGFGVRVKPSGAGVYLVQYRNAQGNTRRYAIGKIGTLTPDEARSLARDKLVEVAKGGDPSAERQAAKGAISVSELCDWYLKEAEAGRLLGKNGRRVKTSTLAMDRSRIGTHVKPLIGKQAVAALSLDDIEAMQSDIIAGKTASSRRETGRGGRASGGAAVAARTVGMLHTIFAQGVRKKRIALNPAVGSRKAATQRRKRRLSDGDLTTLGTALRDAEAAGENATGLRAVRALLLTGFRRMEILAMRQGWVGRSRSGGFVSFPDTKTGEQVRPIGRAALDVLTGEGKPDSFIFPADRGEGHFVGVVKVLDRVCKRAGLKEVSPHVLRHTFASVAGDLGFSKLTIAGLLGHAAGGDTESYVHLDTALLAAADAVSRHIADALDGPAAGAGNIIELQQRAG